MMSERVVEPPHYSVSIYQPEEAGGPLVFTFVPKGPGRERGPNGSPGHIPQFIVEARMESGAPDLDWSRTPDHPEDSAREQIEAEIAARMGDRAIWIGRVTSLVDEVERWATEMGWS